MLASAFDVSSVLEAGMVLNCCLAKDDVPWILDSGATDHVVTSLALFQDFRRVFNRFVKLPNESLGLNSSILNKRLENPVNFSCNISSDSAIELWHNRLGHPSKQRMSHFAVLDSDIPSTDDIFKVKALNQNDSVTMPASFGNTKGVAVSSRMVLDECPTSVPITSKCIVTNDISDDNSSTLFPVTSKGSLDASQQPLMDVSQANGRPRRTCQLPQRFKDYQMDLPKVRTSPHAINQTTKELIWVETGQSTVESKAHRCSVATRVQAGNF
ncbi:hypothetical protein V6N11_010645 [Hibiscus sabdariffa]|uniref:GAG-pre-integrase domain-containing protein n=1 Tax=Hibiscus sabdariffa TaxID=183260 RepID=A0ABR2S621_9ROSI